MAVLLLALALGLAAFLQHLLRGPDSGRSSTREALAYLLLAVFSAESFGWLLIRSGLGPGQFAPDLTAADLLAGTAADMVLGASAFVLARGRSRDAARGALGGLIFSILSFGAGRWSQIAVAWQLIGGFSGSLVRWALPFALAGSFAAAGLALLEEDVPAAALLIAALILAWALSSEAELRRLKAYSGYGPKSLAEAAGLGAAERAETVALAWLKPEAGTPWRLEGKTMSSSGAELSVDSLGKLERYLKERRLRGVFAPQALAALRKGWLSWWEADKALEADTLSEPGRAVPDYLGALALIRAGPLTPERFGALGRLAEMARARREGFEDVTRSQYIFEAFSSAYSRFGDEADARSWLYKIDNLWPIYDKKIDVSPLENFREGEIAGSVMSGGRPAASVLVGLFLVPASTSSVISWDALSASRFPDSAGNFRFGDLGAGRYYLALMARPSELGRVLESPGFIELSEQSPRTRLKPVVIEGP